MTCGYRGITAAIYIFRKQINLLDIPNCLLARLLVLFSVILNRLFLQKATEQGSATYRRNYGEESTCTIHLLDVTSACKTLEFRKGYLVPVLVVERTESWFVTINRTRYIYVPFLAIPVQVAIKRNPKIMYFAHYFACKMQIAMALACRCISRVIVALLVLSLHFSCYRCTQPLQVPVIALQLS